MKKEETVLLEIIDTGPCARSELIQEAPSLIDEVTETKIMPGQIPKLIDRLTSLGHIGSMGIRLDTIVISRQGQNVLHSN